MSAKSKSAPKFKPTPAPADEATITDELREGQKAYLLLQLFNAEHQTLTKGDANKFKDLRKASKISLNFMKAPVANYRRERLAEQGLIQITPGRSMQYSLLPDGRDYLATCVRHLANVEFAIKGSTLNALVTAAQESPFRADRSTPMPEFSPRAPAMIPPNLDEAVLSTFEELRRERHGHSGLVPIHEIRRVIADRLGVDAARHDVLDEAILKLWREKKIGLEGISDLSRATEQQLNDSIPGEGNTIFYLEAPREQSVHA